MNNNLKKLAAALAGLAMLGTLAACGDTGDASVPSADAGAPAGNSASTHAAGDAATGAETLSGQVSAIDGSTLTLAVMDMGWMGGEMPEGADGGSWPEMPEGGMPEGEMPGAAPVERAARPRRAGATAPGRKCPKGRCPKAAVHAAKAGRPVLN